MPEMPKVPGAFPLTHLWFLYQLLLTYVAVLAIRGIVARLDPAQKLRGLIDKAVTASIRTMTATFTLGLPVAAALMSLSFWFYWQGIPTPDQSLIPQIPASVGFGTAFVFGWLVHRSKDALAAIGQRWFRISRSRSSPPAGCCTPCTQAPMAQPGLTKTLYAMVFGVAVWGWVFGLTGAALRFLSNYSATRRYIADASYWIYLAHLPVVAAFQVWVGHWPLHWSVKYPLILVASFAVLFLSYHYFVRPTLLGKLLNGRKYPRKSPPHASTGTPTPSNVTDIGSTGAVARLTGVSKRYGKTMTR